jgi:hypothetical protein
LTLWFEESQLERWHQPERSGYRGCPMTYSTVAIQCGLTIRKLFQLPLRTTEGFLKPLVKLLGARLQHLVPALVISQISICCHREERRLLK